MKINTMALADPWFKMVSISELEKHGAPNAAEEQDKLLGEKLISLLKRPSYKEAHAAVVNFFTPERSDNLQDDVQEFVAAINSLDVTVTKAEVDAMSADELTAALVEKRGIWQLLLPGLAEPPERQGSSRQHRSRE